jgi:WD40 repeat protein
VGELAGHPDGIDGLVFSPDGKSLAVACHNADVRLIDAGTGEVRCILPGYFGTRHGVAFSPDRQTVATASEGHTIRLWDAETGAPRRRLVAHCYVPGLAFSPDGRLLAEWAIANTSTDPGLVVWSLDNTENGRRLEGASFSPDGRWLLWALDGQAALLADPATGEVRCHLEWAGDPPTALAFTADGRGLVVGGRFGAPWEVWPLAALGLDPHHESSGTRRSARRRRRTSGIRRSDAERPGQTEGRSRGGGNAFSGGGPSPFGQQQPPHETPRGDDGDDIPF